MNLRKHIIDTIKEWQLKIGYREGTMKLYYPGESLVLLLGLEKKASEEVLLRTLGAFFDEMEPQLGRIRVSGSYERYCLDIPAKGCAYVAEKVQEPEFLNRFLEVITNHGNSMEQIRTCFASHAEENVTSYREEIITDEHADKHSGHAFYFADAAVEEYIYWVEENEFGLTYHRFTREEYAVLRSEMK